LQEYDDELTGMRASVANYNGSYGSDERIARDDSVSEFTQVDSASEDDDYEETWVGFESDPDSDGPFCSDEEFNARYDAMVPHVDDQYPELVGIETNPGWDASGKKLDFGEGKGKEKEAWVRKVVPPIQPTSSPKPKTGAEPVCYNCRKPGHRVAECVLPVKKCTVCHKIGHWASDCWGVKRRFEVKQNRSGAELVTALKDLALECEGSKDANTEIIKENQDLNAQLSTATAELRVASESTEILKQMRSDRLEKIREQAEQLTFMFRKFVPRVSCLRLLLAVVAGVIGVAALYRLMRQFSSVFKTTLNKSIFAFMGIEKPKDTKEMQPWIQPLTSVATMVVPFLSQTVRTFISGVCSDAVEWVKGAIYVEDVKSYTYTVTELIEHEHEDERPDSNGVRECLHVDPIYATVEVKVETPNFWAPEIKVTQMDVSLEAFMQMCNPKVMALDRSPSVVTESLSQFGASLHSVNWSRHCSLVKEDVIQNTERMAYGYYESQRERNAIIPFPRSLPV